MICSLHDPTATAMHHLPLLGLVFLLQPHDKLALGMTHAIMPLTA